MLTKLSRPLSRPLVVTREPFSRVRLQSLQGSRALSRPFSQQYKRNEKQQNFAYENATSEGVVHSSSYALYLAALVGVAAGGAFYFLDRKNPEETKWEAVRASIAELLESNPKYDDGSYGPLFVRLAWHTSGTYDSRDGTGGSNGATMRFSPEAKWGANAGLDVARQVLEPVKKKFPDVSYADLWTLAGVVAIEKMNGPKIPWRPGRSDAANEKSIKPLTDGRLPDAGKGSSHLKDIFYRMGLNDKEIVALAGAHALGRCHTDRSGYTGPWTRSPTMFTNMYFVELLNNKWTKKKWSGPEQYEDPSGELMMLPADLALLQDPNFKKYVELYAADEEVFFKDFAAAFSKLLELGVPFK